MNFDYATRKHEIIGMCKLSKKNYWILPYPKGFLQFYKHTGIYKKSQRNACSGPVKNG